MTVKRQFIAGVSCPECGRLDKVQRCRDGDDTWMECIACGMKKDIDDGPDENRKPGLIPTRND